MVLDSNILIYAANEPTPELESLATAETSAVASITEIEVYGFVGLRPDDEGALDILFSRLTVYPLDSAVVDQAITLRQTSKMALADAIIAATALVHNVPLVTRNEKDFSHVPGLRIINPFETS